MTSERGENFEEKKKTGFGGKFCQKRKKHPARILRENSASSFCGKREKSCCRSLEACDKEKGILENRGCNLAVERDESIAGNSSLYLS